MANKPEGYVNFEVFENSNNYYGLASVQLPNINYLTQQLNGAGIAGNVEAVFIGMVDAMTTTINFRSATGAAVSLLKPEKHQLDLRAAEQHWATTGTGRPVAADKVVIVVVPKNFTPGTVAPAALADANGEYTTYYYAGYKDGKKLWEIDPYNYICEIDGMDYMAPVRRALGK